MVGKRKGASSKNSSAKKAKTATPATRLTRQSTLYAHTRDVENHGGVTLRPHHRTDERYVGGTSRSPALRRSKRKLRRKDTPAPPLRSRRAAAKKVRSAMKVFAEEPPRRRERVEAKPAARQSRSSSPADTPLFLHVLLASLLAAQLAVYPPLVKRYAKKHYVKAAYVVAQEVCKMLISLVLLAVSAAWCRSPRQKAAAAAREKWSARRAAQVAALPALIYSLQNTLCLVAYESIDGLTFNLLNQTKLIWTAVFVLLLLKKRQTFVQWCALSLLFAAAVLLSLAKSGDEDAAKKGSYVLGCFAALVAALLSGLASACCQWALQVGGRDSYLFSAELGFFSICAIATALGAQYALGWPRGNVDPSRGPLGNDAQRIVADGSLFASLSAATLLPIVVNACGGVVVGLLTKFSGAVRSSFFFCSYSFVYSSVFFCLLSHTGRQVVRAHRGYPPLHPSPRRGRRGGRCALVALQSRRADGRCRDVLKLRVPGAEAGRYGVGRGKGDVTIRAERSATLRFGPKRV